jgi:hypothetical protein
LVLENIAIVAHEWSFVIVPREYDPTLYDEVLFERISRACGAAMYRMETGSRGPYIFLSDLAPIRHVGRRLAILDFLEWVPETLCPAWYECEDYSGSPKDPAKPFPAGSSSRAKNRVALAMDVGVERLIQNQVLEVANWLGDRLFEYENTMP